MILQDEQIIVKVGGLVFNTHHLYTPEYRMDSTGIEGWFDGAPMRRGQEVRPTQWGDFKTEGFLGSRLITITGTAIANSNVELQAMRSEFTNILHEGDYGVIEVWTSSLGSQYAEVGLDTRPQWIMRTDTFASFKVDLLAPDPRKYSLGRSYTIPAKAFVGGLQYDLQYPIQYGSGEPHEMQILTNFGNVDTWPKIIVTGNMPSGFILSNGSGKRITYDAPVTMKSPVTLNFEEGTAIQNKVSKTSNLSRRDWFGISPGSAILPTLEAVNQGQGWMEIQVRDAWI